MANAGILKILVLAHDLSDAAVHRRVAMLKLGGATVTVAGFRRTSHIISEVEGCAAVDFGRTYNAGFLQRIVSVLREIILLGHHRALFASADVILARNLEMLAIGVRGRSLCQPKPKLIYESLDIHRLLLRPDVIGAVLRTLEGWLARRASALITSSPAFVSGYFNTLSKVKLPVKLVENKILSANVVPSASEKPAAPPWIIGWFGMIRCRKSLQILGDLVRQSGGSIDVVIRGRPSPDQFGDFDRLVASMPGVRFLGPYKASDLATMYNGVHFNWAVDMFEEGLNSSWLLPNRLYEGGAYNCVPIADENVEAGRFLKRLGIGVTLKQPLGKSLADFFGQLTPEKYTALANAAAQVPRATWVCDAHDCKALVEYMRELA